LASEVEKQVIPLIANGNITADDGFQQLEAAGIQDWYANLVVTLATTKAEIHQAKIDAGESHSPADHALRHTLALTEGLEVDEALWHRLRAYGDRVLIPNSERSRQGAG